MLQLLAKVRVRYRRRRYKVALAILVAAYTYELLMPLDKRRIDEAVAQVDPGFEGYEESYRASSDDYAAMNHAFAMRDLGIPAAIPGQDWNTMLENRPTKHLSIREFWSHYKYFDEQTNQARVYLRSLVADLDDVIARYAARLKPSAGSRL